MHAHLVPKSFKNVKTLSRFSRPLAAVLSIEFPWSRLQNKSDPNAETNGFATFAFLKHLEVSKKSETFRDGSDGYSGQSITWTRASHTGVSRSSTFVGKEHKSRQKIFVLWVHGPSNFRPIYGQLSRINAALPAPRVRI